MSPSHSTCSLHACQSLYELQAPSFAQNATQSLLPCPTSSPLLFISAIPRVPLPFLSHFLPNPNRGHVRAVYADTSFRLMAQFPTKKRHIKYVNTSVLRGQGPMTVQATQPSYNCQYDMHCITFCSLSACNRNLRSRDARLYT